MHVWNPEGWAGIPARYVPQGVVIGAGAYGEAALFTDGETGMDVVIKRCFNTDLLHIKKVLREVRVMNFFSATQSPHIVPLLDFFIHDAPPVAPPRGRDAGGNITPYFVMPRAVCSLKDVLRHWSAPYLPMPERWPPELKAAVARRDPELPKLLMAQLLLGVHTFHAAGHAAGARVFVRVGDRSDAAARRAAVHVPGADRQHLPG